MVAIVFAVTTAICALGWFAQYISTAALLWYIQEKGCPFPSDKDMKTGTKFVAEHMAKDFFRGKRR